MFLAANRAIRFASVPPETEDPLRFDGSEDSRAAL
jgi:hypothetical protein